MPPPSGAKYHYKYDPTSIPTFPSTPPPCIKNRTKFHLSTIPKASPYYLFSLIGKAQTAKQPNSSGSSLSSISSPHSQTHSLNPQISFFQPPQSKLTNQTSKTLPKPTTKYNLPLQIPNHKSQIINQNSQIPHQTSRSFTTFAGLPMQIFPAGSDLNTDDRAPTTVPRPMVTPGPT